MAQDDSGRRGASHFDRDETARAYRTRPGYTSAAVRYALQESHRLRFWALQRRGLQRMVRRLRILDAGAGTGQVTQDIKALGIPVEIVALDRSASMLRELRTEHSEVPSVQGDIDRLPFPDDTFDVVMFGRSLHWGDPERTPAEVRRVLRPGGALVSLIGSLRGATAIGRAISPRLPSVVAENPITSGAMRGGPLNLGASFLPNSPRRFEYYERMTPGQLRDLLSTYAGLARAPEPVRAQVRARAEAFLAQFGEAERLTVPVVTVVHVARVDKPRLTPRARRKPRSPKQ